MSRHALLILTGQVFVAGYALVHGSWPLALLIVIATAVGLYVGVDVAVKTMLDRGYRKTRVR